MAEGETTVVDLVMAEGETTVVDLVMAEGETTAVDLVMAEGETTAVFNRFICSFLLFFLSFSEVAVVQINFLKQELYIHTTVENIYNAISKLSLK